MISKGNLVIGASSYSVSYGDNGRRTPFVSVYDRTEHNTNTCLKNFSTGRNLQKYSYSNLLGHY